MSDSKDRELQTLNDDASDVDEQLPDVADADSPEEVTRQRIVWLKAVLGELLVTTLFLFIVMAAGVSFARSQESKSIDISNPVIAAVSTGFCAVALIYSFADVSGYVSALNLSLKNYTTLIALLPPLQCSLQPCCHFRHISYS